MCNFLKEFDLPKSVDYYNETCIAFKDAFLRLNIQYNAKQMIQCIRGLKRIFSHPQMAAVEQVFNNFIL